MIDPHRVVLVGASSTFSVRVRLALLLAPFYEGEERRPASCETFFLKSGDLGEDPKLELLAQKEVGTLLAASARRAEDVRRGGRISCFQPERKKMKCRTGLPPALAGRLR